MGPGINLDNNFTVQTYIDGQYANRATYASGCCNNLALQPDVGTVSIGGTSANYGGVKLNVNGSAANGTGVWAIYSDRRLKRDIVPIQGALQAVTALQGVGFNWKDDSKNDQYGRVMGFIAQDVEKVLPQWVKTDSDGYKHIETIGMDALLVESIKEQQQQIEAQGRKIEMLSQEILRLQK